MGDIECSREDLAFLIAGELDKPSVYMGGPSARSKRQAEAIMRLIPDYQGAVDRKAAERFRDALAPGFIVWHDGKKLSPEDTLTQIERGLLAAFGGR